MGLCPAASRFTRKAKYLLLLALCLCVLAWISTLSDGVLKEAELVPTPPPPANDGGRKDAVLEALKELDSTETEPEQTNTEEEQEQEEKEKEEKVIEEVQPIKASCPEKSPLLSGVVKLLFESSLTLAQVQEQNGEVIKGQYEPADCTARQSVAILIPHRNREKHLLYLLYHLHPFLQRQQLHYAIYVIHQAGEAKFNRAKLLNVGYLEALKDFNWDCFIFHDVDLVPENDQNLYRCEDQPKHLVVGRNSTGYRVQLQGMKIIRPPAKIGRYTMVFHKRDSGNEVNKDRMRLLGRATKMWKKDGLNSCTYQTLTVERPLLYINVTVDIGKPHSAH
ncbi:beta-1,4-galactosyltransferase 4 [Astyanax mexicanus]|uniref:Beta-1,4-galactosyltransferase n=1 Tax=Astyanax mexicanus TaxID=7994 RepID=A0A8T2MID7_ASTMX|nr:beta-1,4-galactosyltransferase 4 [Astyanax mexicanus]